MEPQHQSPRSRVRVRVRLTHRGRVAALAFFLLLAFAVLTSVSALHAATQAGSDWPASATKYVTVQPGQTLWQIALRVAPSDDPRDTVDRIRSLNGIGGATVQVGQRLIVPA
ncbi:MAG: LysM peptidoglycan-binding domain-containing protein [Actinomycetes bacterium]